MHNELADLEYEDSKFQAAINGVDLDDSESSSPEESPTTEVDSPVPLFGDPSSYEGKTEEEKQSMTEKMLSKHRSWSSDMKAK